ncbi:uncharacterized protein LOC141678442 [Apium graveolens]|uniref:uncharacterized protein LOC141678442 n=1 Tax=Apium graveolens TaxID=4045 RepID=UPI003D7A0601
MRQLIPFTWRVLACLDAIEEKHKLNIDVDVVKYSYSLKNFSNCRIGFTNKDTEDPLILNNETVNDRNWKKDYVFAEKKTLGEEAAYLLEHWNNMDCDFEFDDNDVDTKATVDEIRSLPVSERLWPNYLGRPICNTGYPFHTLQSVLVALKSTITKCKWPKSSRRSISLASKGWKMQRTFPRRC